MSIPPNPTQTPPPTFRAFDAYATVMLMRDDSSARCSAQVMAGTSRGLEIVCMPGQRFPGWFRVGTAFTITSPKRDLAYLARVQRSTATTAEIELLRRQEMAPPTRAQPRVGVNQPARIVAEVAGTRNELVGLLRDVSLGGCRIATATPLDMDTQLVIVARICASVVEMPGLVVATHQADEIAYDHGVAFHRLDPTAQRVVADFVRLHRAA